MGSKGWLEDYMDPEKVHEHQVELARSFAAEGRRDALEGVFGESIADLMLPTSPPTSEPGSAKRRSIIPLRS